MEEDEKEKEKEKSEEEEEGLLLSDFKSLQSMLSFLHH